MNRRNMLKIKHLLLYIPLTAIVTGCGTTAPTRFYTLSNTYQATSAKSSYSNIELRPVKVPERLKRPQIVLNSATGPQLILLENERWGATFDDELHDAIYNELNHLVSPTHKSYQVNVTLQQLQVIKGQSVQASFSWKVQSLPTIPNNGEASSGLCQFDAQQGIGNSVDAAVQGMQMVVTQLSGKIAQSINRLDTGVAECSATRNDSSNNSFAHDKHISLH